MHDIAPSPQRRRRPLQFRLRTLVLVMLVLCTVLAVIAAKLRQDHNHTMAWTGLQELGVNYSIRSLSGHRVITELVSTRSDFGDSDIEPLLSHIDTLRHARDLGLTRGAEIVLIDLTKSQVSEPAIAKVRAALPNAEVRH